MDAENAPLMPTAEMADDMQMLTTWGVLRGYRDHIEALEAALREVKDMVCGDKHPRWSDADAITRARGRIADLCDAALPHP